MVFLTKTKKPSTKSLAQIRQQIVGIDVRVPTLSGQMTDYVFLDNAASTPVLRPVLSAINQFMPWYSSVHRGTGFKSRLSTEVYEQAREIVLKFFGGNARQHIVIFGKNSTEALNKLSYRLGLSKDDVVLVSLLEHHSNDLPWRKQATVKRIGITAEGHLDEADYDRLLAKYGKRIKLVAVTGGSNITGHVPNVHSLASKAHAIGAQILVDGAQLAPHRTVDIKDLADPEHLDYVVASAHKLYAPFGTGALVGRRDTFEIGEPELCGGGTIDLVTTERIEWAAPPDRDEAGSPNVVGAVAMAKSLLELEAIGMPAIAKHEAELTAYALRKMSQIEGLTLYGDTDPDTTAQRLGVIPFGMHGLSHAKVAAILGTEWGIGVRNGCFCAHPYVTRLLGIDKQGIAEFGEEVVAGDKRHMPGLVRVSFGMYNTEAEVDRLATALQAIAVGQIAGRYYQDKATGEYHASGFEPDLGAYFSLNL